MKKGLLTAFVLASVLVFNACKKEEGPQGPVGPQGPQGPAGPAGAQGPVGSAGAAGKDGTVIRSGEGAPASGLGVDGDYYFDKTAKSLYGPKTAEGWGTATSLQGPAGADGQDGQDGQDGANGTSFTAGAGAPTDAIGSEGDWYFDTNTSTFYGPKSATGWDAGNVLPLGSAYASQTYHIIRGIDDVVETKKEYGQKLVSVYSDYTLLSSYKVSVEDKRRFDNYSLWHENREMIFETVANSGVFNRVPRGAFDFAGSGVATPAGLTSYGITVGANFKYTNAPEEEAHHTYTLLQEDIDRLSVNNGNAFTYLTYAATKPENVVVGEYLTFYQKKALDLVNDTDNYYAEYTGKTTLDINQIVPKLEKWKKEGAYVFVGYNYYTDLNGTNTNSLTDAYGSGTSRGYHDITNHVLSYVQPNVAYGANNEFSTGAGNILSTGTTGTANGTAAMGHANNPFTATPLLAGSGKLGQSVLTIGPGAQYAYPSTKATETHYVNGKLNIVWNITSGTAGTHTLNISPLTLTNPTNLEMEDLLLSPTWVNRAYNREYYTPPRLDYGFNTTTYPIANSVTTHTPVYGWISFLNWGIVGYNTVAGATGIQNVRNNNGGKPASYFDDVNIFRLTINVVPAEVVKSAKAAGVNVNNPEALINFAKSLQLQK